MIGHYRKLKNRSSSNQSERRGTSIVELAFIAPVFFFFMFSLFEIGHAFMVVNTLKAATRKAAREGSAEGVSTATVLNRVDSILSTAFPTASVTVTVKNADVFDTPGMDPSSVNYGSLPSIELSDAEPRQLYIVRAEVEFGDVSLILPSVIPADLNLTGHSIMRHE